MRETNIASVLSDGHAPTLGGIGFNDDELLGINQQSVTIRKDDVFVQWIAGGGGFGDPLLREADKVRLDVIDEYVTTKVAREVYGVIVRSDDDDGVLVDQSATTQERKRIRTARVAKAGNGELASVISADLEGAPNIDLSAPRRDAQGWYCPSSGARLGDAEDWRAATIRVRTPAADRLGELGVRARERDSATESILIEELFGPECGTLLSARVLVEPTEEKV